MIVNVQFLELSGDGECFIHVFLLFMSTNIFFGMFFSFNYMYCIHKKSKQSYCRIQFFRPDRRLKVPEFATRIAPGPIRVFLCFILRPGFLMYILFSEYIKHLFFVHCFEKHVILAHNFFHYPILL